MGKMTRRRFLESGAAASLLTLVPRHVLGRGRTPPSEKLNIAGIGVGGMGAANLRELESENIVALCDVGPELRGQDDQAIPRRPRCARITARCWRSRRISTRS